jgi:voltage-gated potassium channel
MTGRRFPAMRLMGRVMLRSAGQLISVLVTLSVFWLAAGYLMHSAETNLPNGNHEQFGDIGESLWASVVILTTLPSLEVVPGTLIGRVIAGFIALLGIGLFALPAGILTSNFMEAYQHARDSAGQIELSTCWVKTAAQRGRSHWPPALG